LPEPLAPTTPRPRARSRTKPSSPAPSSSSSAAVDLTVPPPLSTLPRKRGRKHKPFRADDGHVEGLYRRPDGRWRIVATGAEFTEPDERLAVARFREWQRNSCKDLVPVSIATAANPGAYMPSLLTAADAGLPLKLTFSPGGDVRMSTDVPAAQLWGWLRVMLLNRADLVAREVGIPEVARLADLPARGPSPSLAELVQTYSTHAEVKVEARRKARRIVEDFTAVTGAATLRDVTTAAALRWGDAVKGRGYGPATVKNYFQRLKSVLSFARKRGVDAAQVRAALDGCAVLVPPKGATTFDPRPIAPADFHRLLKAAGKVEKAFLLLALNCCLYAAEALEVRWSELDLEGKVFVSARAKTGMVRAAVLWPRTVAALRAVRRTGSDFVFVSARGTAYHPNSFRKVFAQLRTRAGVRGDIKISDIRDGAYSAAVESRCDANLCNILAGHRCGMSDHYVKRRPSIVKPACEGVERYYFKPRRGDGTKAGRSGRAGRGTPPGRVAWRTTIPRRKRVVRRTPKEGHVAVLRTHRRGGPRDHPAECRTARRSAGRSRRARARALVPAQGHASLLGVLCLKAPFPPAPGRCE
jgi:integrase